MQLQDVSQPMYTVLFSKKPEFVLGRYGPCVALNAAQRALKGLEKSDIKKGAFPNPKFRRIETLSTKKYKNKILRQSLVEKVNKFTKLKRTIFWLHQRSLSVTIGQREGHTDGITSSRFDGSARNFLWMSLIEL